MPGMEKQEEGQDWADLAFCIQSDHETSKEFHGFGRETTIQGRLIIEEAGGDVQVSRARR